MKNKITSSSSDLYLYHPSNDLEKVGIVLRKLFNVKDRTLGGYPQLRYTDHLPGYYFFLEVLTLEIYIYNHSENFYNGELYSKDYKDFNFQLSIIFETRISAELSEHLLYYLEDVLNKNLDNIKTCINYKLVIPVKSKRSKDKKE